MRKKRHFAYHTTYRFHIRPVSFCSLKSSFSSHLLYLHFFTFFLYLTFHQSLSFSLLISISLSLSVYISLFSPYLQSWYFRLSVQGPMIPLAAFLIFDLAVKFQNSRMIWWDRNIGHEIFIRLIITNFSPFSSFFFPNLCFFSLIFLSLFFSIIVHFSLSFFLSPLSLSISPYLSTSVHLYLLFSLLFSLSLPLSSLSVSPSLLLVVFLFPYIYLSSYLSLFLSISLSPYLSLSIFLPPLHFFLSILLSFFFLFHLLLIQ